MYKANLFCLTWNEADTAEHLRKLVLEAGYGLQGLLAKIVLLREHPASLLT